MGFRFHRSIGLAKGLRLNVNKGGLSLSVGGRGAGVTFGGSRGANAHVGLPGTGLSYDTHIGGQGRRRRPAAHGLIGLIVVAVLVLWAWHALSG
jgi:hypothetical protein